MTDNKKEEDNVMDFQFDTISEINLKNSSFYSLNDDLKGSNNMILKSSKLDNKIDMDSVRMLPMFIEKVSQNIKFIDHMINKQKSLNNSKSSSKEKISQNNLNNSSITEQLQDITNITNLVKKSVDGVNELLNNKKLNLSNCSSGNITPNSQIIEKINLQPIHINRINNSSNFASMSTNYSSSHHMTTKNFEIIEERDEDMISKKSKALNESHLKKPISSNINKFTGLTKKNGANSEATSPKKNTIDSSKIKLNLKKQFTIDNITYTQPLKPIIDNKNTTITINSVNKGSETTDFQTISHRSNRNKLNVESQKTLNKSSNIMNKKPLYVNPNTSKFTPQHAKTSSFSYNTTTDRAIFHNKSKKDFNNFTDRSHLNAKNSSISSNLIKVNKKSIKGANSVKDNNRNIRKHQCYCKCHLHNKQSVNINNKTNANDVKNTNNHKKVNIINNLKELKEVSAKNIAKMIHLYNELIINIQEDVNSDLLKMNNIHSYKNLSKLLRNFIDSTEDDIELGFNGNISMLNNSQSNSLVNFDYDSRKYELSSRRTDNVINNKYIGAVIIQRKWRENKLKKILLPLSSNSQLNNFSINLFDKNDLIKLCKSYLYRKTLKNSQKFQQIFSLINQASNIWTDLMKNDSNLFLILDSIIHLETINYGFIGTQSSSNISMSNFISFISKFLTSEINKDKKISTKLNSFNINNDGKFTRNVSINGFRNYKTMK